MITPERLAEIKDYCAKATAGPWNQWAGSGWLGERMEWPIVAKEVVVDGFPTPTQYTASAAEPQDQKFIAKARTDLPLLVEEVERLGQMNNGLAKQSMDVFMQLSAAEKRIEELGQQLPETYYAGVPLLQRVHFMVNDWRRAVSTIQLLEDDNQAMELFLMRQDYKRCDIAACNCGSWHKRTQP